MRYVEGNASLGFQVLVALGVLFFYVIFTSVCHYTIFAYLCNNFFYRRFLQSRTKRVINYSFRVYLARFCPEHSNYTKITQWKSQYLSVFDVKLHITQKCLKGNTNL